MPNPMGLTGASNPIFQASQTIVDQTGQQKQAAVQGIINKQLDAESKKLAAELNMWTKLAVESTNPTTIAAAFAKLGSLVDKDFTDAAPDENAIQELKDIRKVMNDATGTYSPDAAKSLWNDYVSRHGKDFITQKEEEAFTGNLEAGYLGQASTLSQQAKATPGLAESPEITGYVQQEQDRLLSNAGTKGKELLAKGMETSEDKTNYKERDLPLKGGMEQRQFSMDGGKTWQNLGSPSKKGGTRDTYADEQVRNRMVTNFNADPNVRRFGQMENFANIINEAASGDNPIAHASIPTLMARAVGEVGALTEADKKPFGGSSALIPRLEQALTQLASGKRTPDNIKLLQDLSDTLIKGSQRNKVKIAKERAKQYSKVYKGRFTEDDIFDMLSPGSMETETPVPTAVGTPKRRASDKNSDPLGLR